jgi:hypothetical protein
VNLDRARLPRIWLQGEVAEATLVGEETISTPGEDENPYKAPRLAASSPGARRNQAIGCLWVWFGGAIGPLRVLLQSERRLLKDPSLPVPRDMQTDRTRRLRQAYVRALRRQAWVMLPLTVLFPAAVALALIIGGGLRSSQAGDWIAIAICAVLLHGAAVTLGMAIAAQLFQRGPDRFKLWLKGGVNAIDAATDPPTGYYGVRLRLINIHAQAELPRVKFRVRKRLPGEVCLRLVNYERALALEWPLIAGTGETWTACDFDLRLLVRQSAPDFFGDELHLVGEPDQGPLEMADYEVVFRP